MNRRRLLIAGAIVGVLSAGVITLWFSIPSIGNWYVRTRVLPRLAKRMGRDVAVKAIHVTRGRVVLDGVTISGSGDGPDGPLFEAAQIAVDFDFWKAMRGDFRLGVLEVERPRVNLAKAKDGTDNWRDVIENLRRKGTGKKKGRSLRPTAVVLTHGALAYADLGVGVRLSVEEVGGKIVPRGTVHFDLARMAATSGFGPSAAVDALTFDMNLTDPEGTARLDIEGASASLYTGLSVTNIHGTIAPGTQQGRAQIALTGGYGGVDANLWHAEGWLDPAQREGDMHVRADKFTLDKLAPILKRSHVKSPENATVDAALDLSVRGKELTFTGGFEVAGLTVFHTYVAAKPIQNLGMKGSIRGRYDHPARLFEVESASVQFRGIEAVVEGYVAFAGGADEAPGGLTTARREQPRLRAHLVVPDVLCQTALAAVPPEVAPRLQGFKLTGKFAADLMIDIDWANLDALELTGIEGLLLASAKGNRCKVKKAPKDMDTKRLKEEFEHTVEVEPKQWMTFIVGQTNPDFVPLYDVSPYLMKSFMTTEDSGFYHHHGFIVSEFRTALIANLKARSFKRGASSITMQFVKNIMLYREKTLARKLQELFLTWYVEQTLEKDRIMEIYVNAIEFGPGIYGIGRAAQHYFGKHPRDLNPVEAAFFSYVLPHPKQTYLQYCEGKLNRWGDDKVKRILKRMLERERLTEEEYEKALVTPLVFVPPEEETPEKCLQRTRKLIKRAGTTMPKSPPPDLE